MAFDSLLIFAFKSREIQVIARAPPVLVIAGNQEHIPAEDIAEHYMQSITWYYLHYKQDFSKVII